LFHEPFADVRQRRRAQNRASQRAFRERKDRHLRSLKVTLESLGQKHQCLLNSYSQQSEAVIQLKHRIAELQMEIATLSTPQTSPTFEIQQPCQNYACREDFNQFDAFAFNPSSQKMSQTIFWQNQSYQSSKTGVVPANTSNLQDFDDLLNLP
jgi:hypothetical protein